ncbi:MAG: hypothetical protein HOV81_32415 [Kofleriaceae bacterium]|nr:hypothetical protein [Kofleriaceae bacterium]
MRKLLAWLGVVTCVLVFARTAQAEDVLKPYVFMILDTSGSMILTSTGNPTGAGPPTCGGVDNKLDHAKCAINKIVNSYGDMVFGLSRFRATMGGTTTNFPTGCCIAGSSIGANGSCGAGPNCGGGNTADHTLQILSPLVNGGNANAAKFTNFTGNSCDTGGTDPEIWDGVLCSGNACGGGTPIGGSLAGAHKYWRGLQANDGTTLWPSNVAGFDPIRVDPTRQAFLPTGCDSSPTCTTNCCTAQCRTYLNILLTDGDESCNGNGSTAADAMLRTDLPTGEVACNDALDNENDGFVNDGCPAVGAAETSCSDDLDNDGDGAINDGCPATASRYRIETKVIGFGISPGNANIEAYAHAGGAVDIPSVNEGYYANNEAELQLAFSQILADAIKVEACNDLDDDCDGRADEDFLPPKSVPGKGGTCTNGQLGACSRPGTLVCRADGTGLECNAPIVTPGTETCNNADDDCDGRIDEAPAVNCTPCQPVAETCNAADDDCDGVPDQTCRCSNDNTILCDGVGNDCGTGSCVCTPIVRDCAKTVPGVGTCAGTELCTSGMFQGCTAPTPTSEACNGLDDDCDGNIDGFTQACSDMVTPGGPPTDNPGDPSHSPIPENICHPGTKTCPLVTMPPNSFGACSGEVKPCNGLTPCTDPCNGIDDDCDNLIDEDFEPADCSSNCGVGQTVCTNGQITCNSMPASSDTTCNNVDDDCDGMFDEDWTCPNPVGTMCPCGTGMVCGGQEACVNGTVVCQGDPIGVETCNCMDDNCNGQVDEGTLCSGGGACVNCQCAFPCAPGEFPCPLGKKCDSLPDPNDPNGPPQMFCVNDPCFQQTCQPDSMGNAQECVPKPNDPNDWMCQPICQPGHCTAPLICYGPTGDCRPNNCSTFPEMCSAQQTCINGTCVTNPCQGVTCDGGQYCVGGACVPSCADVECPDGQRCRQGMCETDPCGHACPFGQACNDSTGQCIADPCKDRTCTDDGQWCNPNSGQCETDPCVESNVTCPNPGEVCRGGTCFDPDSLRPDGGEASHVTVGGGGGCSTMNGSSAGVLVALGLLLRRRRRVRAQGGAQ